MEKRTLLAVTLSLLVLLFYNSFLIKSRPTPDVPISTQLIEDNQVTTLETKRIESTSDLITPSLPSPATALIEEIQIIDGELVRLEFSNIGGNIKSVTIKKHPYQLPITDILDLSDYSNVVFSVANVSEKQISYTYKDESGATIHKEYKISDNPNVVDAEITITNPSNMSKLINPGFSNFTINSENLDEKAIPMNDRSLFEYSVAYENIIYI